MLKIDEAGTTIAGLLGSALRLCWILGWATLGRAPRLGWAYSRLDTRAWILGLDTSYFKQPNSPLFINEIAPFESPRFLSLTVEPCFASSPVSRASLRFLSGRLKRILEYLSFTFHYVSC